MQETILTLQDVSYSYQTKAQTVHAVREVRCSFETGRFYAIMGRSGSGKTTLLSLMAGLELPDSGQVCYRETPTRCCACPTDVCSLRRSAMVRLLYAADIGSVKAAPEFTSF